MDIQAKFQLQLEKSVCNFDAYSTALKTLKVIHIIPDFLIKQKPDFTYIFPNILSSRKDIKKCNQLLV